MKALRILIALVAAGLVAVTTVVAAPTKSRPAVVVHFKVTSTLDGMTVLPHHLHWVASTSLPAAEVNAVDFLIDGTLRWVEHKAPYVYSSDNQHGGDYGYLVTSWLTPGLHHFSVKVAATDGRTASDTVTARVLPAAAVPAALLGKWQRTLDKPVPADPGVEGTQPNPAGVYTITFTRRFIQDRYPGTFSQNSNVCYGCIIDDDYVPGPSTFQVWGSVIFEPDTYWQTHPEGGWWCNANGPSATYSWSVSGNTLTLAPVGGKDRCGQRGRTWTGEWTRVK